MSASELTNRKCKPCEGGVEPLSGAGARAMMAQVPGWELVDNTALRRKFKFAGFRQAQSWLNSVADIAENENHHPDIQWSYNKVTIDLSTHSIGGLSENDFILAAKINELE